MKLGAALTAVVALLLATGASAGSPVHKPIYMPDTTHVGAAALQPPPVCCAPAGPPGAGGPAPLKNA